MDKDKEPIPTNIVEYSVPGMGQQGAIVLLETEENHPDREQLLKGQSLCCWVYNEVGKLIPLIAFNRQAYYVYVRHSAYVFELYACGFLTMNFSENYENVQRMSQYKLAAAIRQQQAAAGGGGI